MRFIKLDYTQMQLRAARGGGEGGRGQSRARCRGSAWEEGENADEARRGVARGARGEKRGRRGGAGGRGRERSVELPTERNPDRFHRGLT